MIEFTFANVVQICVFLVIWHFFLGLLIMSLTDTGNEIYSIPSAVVLILSVGILFL